MACHNSELATQVLVLEGELLDVKKERDDYRKDLAYYREKLANLTSLGEEQVSRIRDLERQLERTNKGFFSSEEMSLKGGEDNTKSTISVIAKITERGDDGDIELLHDFSVSPLLTEPAASTKRRRTTDENPQVKRAKISRERDKNKAVTSADHAIWRHSRNPEEIRSPTPRVKPPITTPGPELMDMDIANSPSTPPPNRLTNPSRLSPDSGHDTVEGPSGFNETSDAYTTDTSVPKAERLSSLSNASLLTSRPSYSQPSISLGATSPIPRHDDRVIFNHCPVGTTSNSEGVAQAHGELPESVKLDRLDLGKTCSQTPPHVIQPTGDPRKRQGTTFAMESTRDPRLPLLSIAFSDSEKGVSSGINSTSVTDPRLKGIATNPTVLSPLPTPPPEDAQNRKASVQGTHEVTEKEQPHIAQQSASKQIIIAKNPTNGFVSPTLESSPFHGESSLVSHRLGTNPVPMPVREYDPVANYIRNTGTVIQDVNGGAVRRPITFSWAKWNHIHVLLDEDNCPTMPVRPGEPAVVFLSDTDMGAELARSHPRMSLFIHDELTFWEYGGEYDCELHHVSVEVFKMQRPEFKDRFVWKYLLAQRFRQRYMSKTDETIPYVQITDAEKEQTLEGIESGEVSDKSRARVEMLI
ncbi:hypothetical protein H0H81_003430 [Sphagnurus paluster]|uniref:DUF6697 domain-containing protein n=1 Tax=Sphagnurus paluster TaxID=117069 RepID=A0A9P7FYT6_9AGAR|nr:hypothetical protein H0H81_003430 [Sphagnurus paluster]